MSDAEIFWLNTLDIPSCLLVSGYDDLRNGEVIADLVESVSGTRPQQRRDSSPGSSVAWIRACLNALNSARGPLPAQLLDPAASVAISRGDPAPLSLLIRFIRYCKGEGEKPPIEAPAPAPSEPVIPLSLTQSPIRSRSPVKQQIQQHQVQQQRSPARARSPAVLTHSPLRVSRWVEPTSIESASTVRKSMVKPAQVAANVNSSGSASKSKSPKGVQPQKHSAKQPEPAPVPRSHSAPRSRSAPRSQSAPKARPEQLGASRHFPEKVPASVSALFTSQPPASQSQSQTPVRAEQRGNTSVRSSPSAPRSYRHPSPTPPLRVLSFVTAGSTPLRGRPSTPLGMRSSSPGIPLSTSRRTSVERRSSSDALPVHARLSGSFALSSTASSVRSSVSTGVTLPRNHTPHHTPLSVHQEEMIQWLAQLDIHPREYLLTKGLGVDSSRDPLSVSLRGARSFSALNDSSALSSTDVANSFTDGILLCKLVSNLTGNDVVGVDQHPKSTAAELVNLNRALAVLRPRKKMSPKWLWAAESIQKADAEALWGLLEDIRRDFGSSIPVLHRTTPLSASKHLSTKAPQFTVSQGGSVSSMTDRSSVTTVGSTASGYPVPSSLARSRSSVPSAAPTTVRQEVPTGNPYPNSPYHVSDTKRLEESLLVWLSELGVTSHIDPPPQSLDGIIPYIQDGTLLCDAVGIICNKKVLGVFDRPRNSRTRLANIVKGLEMLRHAVGMSHRHLWSEQDLASGDIDATLGLLEDMRRFYDGLPARSTKRAPNEVPYLGGTKSLTASSNGGSSRQTSYERPVTPPTELRSIAPSPSRFLSPSHIPIAPERFSIANSGTESLPPPPQSGWNSASEMSLVDDSASARSRNEPTAGYLLVRWIQSLGVHIQSPFALDGSVATEFTDGLILCRLVEKLEHRILSGITQRPRSTASCLHNINKALEVLRSRKNMGMQYLWSAPDILRGNTTIIINLLEEIRHAYGHHLSTALKTRSFSFAKMNVNLRARAKTNHIAANDYELEFREGDIITILTVDGDAATAELRGMRGVLNLNLVDILQDAPSGQKGIPIAGQDDVRIQIPSSQAGWRGSQPAQGDIMNNWDEEGERQSPAGIDPQLSGSSSQYAAAMSQLPTSLPPVSPGGSNGSVPQVELSQQDMVMIAYADHVFKGDALLLNIRRHFYWVGAIELVLMFLFLIFYFTTSWTVSAHDIWFHLPHIFRIPVVFYLVYKLGSIATLEQLKLVLDSNSEEHKEFFGSQKLVITMVGAFFALTILAVVLDFIAIWVRVGEMPRCYTSPIVSVFVDACTMTSVLLVFTVLLQILSAATLAWAPTVKWGVPKELWQVLRLHADQYLPSFLLSSPKQVTTPAPAPQPQQAPVTPEGAPAGETMHV